MACICPKARERAPLICSLAVQPSGYFWFPLSSGEHQRNFEGVAVRGSPESVFPLSSGEHQRNFEGVAVRGSAEAATADTTLPTTMSLIGSPIRIVPAHYDFWKYCQSTSKVQAKY